jgi:hypothetical protein
MPFQDHPRAVPVLANFSSLECLQWSERIGFMADNGGGRSSTSLCGPPDVLIKLLAGDVLLCRSASYRPTPIRAQSQMPLLPEPPPVQVGRQDNGGGRSSTSLCGPPDVLIKLLAGDLGTAFSGLTAEAHRIAQHPSERNHKCPFCRSLHPFRSAVTMHLESGDDALRQSKTSGTCENSVRIRSLWRAFVGQFAGYRWRKLERFEERHLRTEGQHLLAPALRQNIYRRLCTAGSSSRCASASIRYSYAKMVLYPCHFRIAVADRCAGASRR